MGDEFDLAGKLMVALREGYSADFVIGPIEVREVVISGGRHRIHIQIGINLYRFTCTPAGRKVSLSKWVNREWRPIDA